MVQVDVALDGEVTVCKPFGELDAFTVSTFREQLAVLAGAGEVVIDLGGVPFMDSAGLGALIGGIRKLREAGGKVVVVCARSAVLRLLHTTGFDRMVAVVGDYSEARSAFDEQ